MNFKKINWKRALIISGWSTLFAAIVVLMGFVSADREKIKCQGIQINIVDEQSKGFIDRADVIAIVQSKSKHVIGTRMSDINIPVLEKIINNNPFVKQAQVYSSIDGMLHVDVEQRTPVVRIINDKDESFYIDTEGKFMPVSDKYTHPVLIANGFIYDTYVQQQVFDSSFYVTADSVRPLRIIDQLFYLANYINRDTLMNDMTEQVYVNSNHEFELVPRVGDHVILLGDISNLEEKILKLKKFYTDGLNKAGWDLYSVINLKFKNQVVCTRKNNSIHS
jgi:cell division protein FtsQ